MKKNIYIAAFALAMVLPVAAQETYEVADVSTQDLNGTARYVGMGGAMEALGADISTMSTNPAGIGVFRHSQVSGSMGMVSQASEESFASANKTNMSFDQIGFVYSTRTSRRSFLNIGFNYHKSRNFDQLLSVADRLAGASQSKLTYDKFSSGLIKSANDLTYSQADVLFHETLYDNSLLNDDDTFNADAYSFDGDRYQFNRGNTGYIGEYDFNISGNLNDRVYLGMTIGIHDVNYRGHTLYNEKLVSNPLDLQTAALEDQRQIDGTGADVKFGIIVRPVETSPFRIGLYLNSPIFYSLETSNSTGLRLNNQYYRLDGSDNPRYGVLEYEYRTPWKFGLSLGHTIGSQFALGATYEYSDYASTDARIKGDEGYDYYYDYYYDDSYSDDEMNWHIKQTLKGVSTLKLGVEYRPDPTFSVRAGYNYVSPMYQQDAYRGVDVWSLGNYFSSETSYVNWKATHRLTLGLGVVLDNLKLDLAYQYQAKKGQFLPFAGDDANLPFDTEVSNNRNQLLMTLAYTF